MPSQQPKIFVKFKGRSVRDVVADLASAMEQLYGQYYRGGSGCGPIRDVVFPMDLPRLWPAVYTVKGGSEGWYVHFDLIGRSEKHFEIGIANSPEFFDGTNRRAFNVSMAKFCLVDDAIEYCARLTRLVLDSLDWDD